MKREVQRGFTIIEVMVASAVFAFAVLGLLFALHIATDVSREAQRQKTVRLELQSRLARLSMPPIKALSQEARVESVRYREEIQGEDVRAPDSSRLDGFWRVKVIAEWLEGGETRSWEASHLVWSP